MSQEVKKLIDWETFGELLFNIDSCEGCRHQEECFYCSEPHPTCPIWAGLEDAGLRVREIDTSNEPDDDDPSPMF